MQHAGATAAAYVQGGTAAAASGIGSSGSCCAVVQEEPVLSCRQHEGCCCCSAMHEGCCCCCSAMHRVPAAVSSHASVPLPAGSPCPRCRLHRQHLRPCQRPPGLCQQSHCCCHRCRRHRCCLPRRPSSFAGCRSCTLTPAAGGRQQQVVLRSMLASMAAVSDEINVPGARQHAADGICQRADHIDRWRVGGWGGEVHSSSWP
jgi:hypothetical protein